MQPDTTSPVATATAVHAAPPGLPRLSRRLRLQYESAQSRWVLLYPEGMVQFNDSAAEILRRCDGRHSVADIVRELEALFDTQGIAVQVQSLIDEGMHRGWID